MTEPELFEAFSWLYSRYADPSSSPQDEVLRARVTHHIADLDHTAHRALIARYLRTLLTDEALQQGSSHEDVQAWLEWADIAGLL